LPAATCGAVAQKTGTDGKGGGKFADADNLASAIEMTWPLDTVSGQRYVVCTGGEPLLQLDAALIARLHLRGFQIAVETNGTLAAPDGIDWICVSPKAGAKFVQRYGDELKVVFPQRELDPADFELLSFRHFFLQPMDGPAQAANTAAAVAYCLAHPQWRLSLQTHKIVGID
jgi:7-carboxy-7-deazaguanine synthase (Cx14CxxC type)